MALVIEWDDIQDLGQDLGPNLGDDLQDDFESATVVRAPAPPIGLAVVTMVGALGVLALAAWGLHRLTA